MRTPSLVHPDGLRIADDAANLVHLQRPQAVCSQDTPTRSPSPRALTPAPTAAT